MELTSFSTRDSYDKCQVFAIRFLPFGHTVFISYGSMFSKSYNTAPKFCCKSQKKTCGTTAWSHRHFIQGILDMHVFAAPGQKFPSTLVPLDLMKKMFG